MFLCFIIMLCISLFFASKILKVNTINDMQEANIITDKVWQHSNVLHLLKICILQCWFENYILKQLCVDIFVFEMMENKIILNAMKWACQREALFVLLSFSIERKSLKYHHSSMMKATKKNKITEKKSVQCGSRLQIHKHLTTPTTATILSIYF